MKLAKSLLLGSAAGLVAVAGAQAADLPVRAAAPVDYVRTCPNAPVGGTGFFVIPGTETCLKISGFLRADYIIADDTTITSTGLNTRPLNDSGFFARGRVEFDARTPTEYGVLRSFIRIQAERGFNGGTVITGARNDTYLDQGYIQFAGITAGRLSSRFDFKAFGDLMSLGAFNSDTGTELLAYTATFGSGFSATVSLEQPSARRTANPSVSGTSIVYGGQSLPDLVANLRVDQAWGSAQIMGALHEIRHNGSAPFIGVDDELGFAVGGGVEINLPMIAPGDALWLTAIYADGALGYLGGGYANSSRDIGVGGVSDAYLNAAGTSLSNATGYSIAAGFTHYWTPTFWTSIQGGYLDIDVPANVEAAAPTCVTTINTCSTQDFSAWQVGAAAYWRPVSNLTVGVDAIYTQLHTDRNVVSVGAVAPGDDTDGIWAGRLRMQRAF